MSVCPGVSLSREYVDSEDGSGKCVACGYHISQHRQYPTRDQFEKWWEELTENMFREINEILGCSYRYIPDDLGQLSVCFEWNGIKAAMPLVDIWPIRNNAQAQFRAGLHIGTTLRNQHAALVMQAAENGLSKSGDLMGKLIEPGEMICFRCAGGRCDECDGNLTIPFSEGVWIKCTCECRKGEGDEIDSRHDCGGD